MVFGTPLFCIMALCLDLDFNMVFGLWYNHYPNFGSLSWFWRCKEHLCPSSSHLGLWRMLEVPDWGLVSWSWFGYGHWSLIHPWSNFWLSILILKVHRTSMSFKSSFGDLEDAVGSWLGFCILALIWIWSLVFVTPKFWILALYLDFEGVKNIYAILVLILGFGRCWRFLTGLLSLYIVLDMVIGLLNTQDPKFWVLFWFKRCKEQQCPWSLHFGLRSMPEVPNWGLAF